MEFLAETDEAAMGRNRLIEFQGKEMTVAEWAEHFGMRPSSLLERLGYMPLEVALTKPKLKRGGRRLAVRVNT